MADLTTLKVPVPSELLLVIGTGGEDGRGRSIATGPRPRNSYNATEQRFTGFRVSRCPSPASVLTVP